MIRHLLPRFDTGTWCGSMAVSGGDADGQGRWAAVEWLGWSVEIIFAREQRVPPPATEREHP